MNLGMIFLKVNVLGYITLQELDWISENEKNIYRKYAELLVKAQNATERNEANLLIKKAAKLQNKFVLSI